MILFSSDTDESKRKALHTALIYLFVTIFLALFGAIYELNGKGVYSYFMLYAFAFPLVGGVTPFMLFAVIKNKYYPCYIERSLWHCGIATLSVGSLFCGVIEIFGTTNSLSSVYWIVGGASCLSSVVVCVVRKILDKRIG